MLEFNLQLDFCGNLNHYGDLRENLILRHKNLWPVRHKSLWFTLNPHNIFQKKTSISILSCQNPKSLIPKYNQSIKSKEKHQENIRSKLLVKPLLTPSWKFIRRKNSFPFSIFKNKPLVQNQNMNKGKEIIQERKTSKFFKKIESNFQTPTSFNSRPDLIDDSSSNFKQITCLSTKQQRLEIWNKIQKALSSELQNIILDKILQPNKFKKILQDLSEYLMIDWCWPKLSIPCINVNPSSTMIRSLYKGLIRLASIDYNYTLDMFPKMVSTILGELRDDKKKIDMIIYSRIEEKKLTKTIYSFQIYYLMHTQFSDKDGILKDKPVEDFDIEDYILVNYINVY